MNRGQTRKLRGARHHAELLLQAIRDGFHAARALAQQVAINRKTEDDLRTLNEELERRVAERTVALERSNQDLSQFAYVASHDLQEPLRMISSYTQLLQRRYVSQMNEEAQSFMRFAADGARRMQDLVTDLLTYAQIDRERKPLAEVDVRKAVDQAIDALKLAITQENAKITVDPLPVVLGDESLVAQVFQNLVSNSLKYRSTEPPRIHIWAVPGSSSTEWKFFGKTMAPVSICSLSRAFSRCSRGLKASKPAPAQDWHCARRLSSTTEVVLTSNPG
jgi:light-regulated signal transduction histidine kinase (bacteriophytochrome)